MKLVKHILKPIQKCGGKIIDSGEDGFACTIPRNRYFLCIIASWGKDWDHVSVHAQASKGQQFCPFWEDMSFVKQLFFKESEIALQYHPPRKYYVDNHPYTLHLWRPQNQEIILPPIWMV